MTTTKKYYWLKLKSDFFTSIAMKKLRRIAGGDTYTIIYLKLQLLSLKDEGTLFFEGVEPSFHEEMALALDEDAENVRATLIFLEETGLIKKVSESEYMLTQVPYLLGSEGDSAERMRRLRSKKASLGDGTVTKRDALVTKSDTEIDIDIEKDIEIDKEREKKKRFTPPTLQEVKDYCLERGNNVDAQRFVDYYTSQGWKVGKHPMKDWKAAVRTWERNSKPKRAEELDDFYTMLSDWAESED